MTLVSILNTLKAASQQAALIVGNRTTLWQK
jgi:hypothetical protein